QTNTVMGIASSDMRRAALIVGLLVGARARVPDEAVGRPLQVASNCSSSALQSEVRRLVRGAMAAEIGSLVDQFGRSFQAADLGLSKMASGLLATQSVVNEVETATNSKLANFRGAVAKDMQTLQGQLLGLSHRLTALHGLVRQLAPSQSAYRQAVFEEIYEANRWGAAGGGSGGGSDLGATEPLRVGLLEAIAEHSIGLVVDAGCGSLAWVPDLLAAAEARGHRPAYCGADI
ncbi:unnamed protein product, partial [Polarella glacialis]